MTARTLALPRTRLAPRGAERQDRDASTDRLLRELAGTTCPEQRDRLREEVVLLNLSLADGLAARYNRRGIPADDLQQVARLALVRAVDRFDAEHHAGFASYAIPCIRGELRRHFRDHGWAVRPPRRLQEALMTLADVRPGLTQELSREPTAKELAVATGLPLSTVTEALTLDGCYTPESLDRAFLTAESEGPGAGLSLVHPDDGVADCEARLALREVAASLSARDRRILDLRFGAGYTQDQIGEVVGVTQMQVSRILARILGQVQQAVG